MQNILRLIFLALAVVVATPASAKPVSYAGGVSPMIMNNGEVNAASITYSPTAHYAIGFGVEYWREKDYTIQSLQLNNLIKRWNFPDSQGNIYLQSGIGVAYSDTGEFEHELEPAAFTGVLADWEDRRFFISYENRFTEAGDIDSNFMQSARVGVAPYIGEFNDLHTWLMVEVGHYPEAENKVTVTPMVRFFKNTHLIEAGISNQGDLLFNWMIQF